MFSLRPSSEAGAEGEGQVRRLARVARRAPRLHPATYQGRSYKGALATRDRNDTKLAGATEEEEGVKKEEKEKHLLVQVIARTVTCSGMAGSRAQGCTCCRPRCSDSRARSAHLAVKMVSSSYANMTL